MDLSGPHVEGRGYGMAHHGLGYRYFLVAIYQPPPDAEGKAIPAWPYIKWLRGKMATETLKAIKRIVAEVDADHVSRAVFRMHSDRGGEFVNEALQAWADDRGIRLTTTEGHGPAGNGQAESFVGKVKQRARTMISMAGLGTEYWTFAVDHAALCSRLKAQGRELPDVPPFGKRVFARINNRPTTTLHLERFGRHSLVWRGRCKVGRRCSTRTG